MKMNSCMLKLDLGGKIAETELKESAADFEATGLDPAAAMVRAVEEKLELAQMEERAIIKAVRAAYEAKGGKPRPVAVKAAPTVAAAIDAGPDAMHSSMPVFYSALARALPAMAKIAGKDGKVNAEQARAWLQARQKEGKFKADELQWSGVDDWLQAQGGKVSVDDIGLFLEENGVQVEEVHKGEAIYNGTLYDDETDSYAFADTEGNIVESGFDTEADASAAMRRTQDYQPGTKYSQYTLPGGENYRELLLTLPVKAKGAFATLDDDGYINERFDTEKEARAAAERDGLTWDRAGTADTSGIYSSSHWDEKNIVAHIRFNDRVDADGKRVLFIEELQSDWGQQGLKHGFQTDDLKIDGKTASEWQNEAQRLFDAMPDMPSAEDRARTQAASANARTLRDRARDRGLKDGRQVATAPFVTDTKAWLSLGIKRMIRYAAENGYDKVAFVNGQQSADRYDLSKQISEIEYEKADDGTYEIIARDLNRKDVIHDEEIDIERVAELVGKEIAQKIENGEGNDRSTAYRSWRMLSGLDLKVGGDGMKSFYDKIVPQTINDVLKKLGGGKVGALSIELPGLAAADRNYYEGPEHSLETLKDALVIARKGGGNIMENPLTGKRLMFAFNRVNNETALRRLIGLMERGVPFNEAVLDDDLLSNGFAELMGGDFKPLPKQKSSTTQQAAFDITPELRASALDGLPLFSKDFNPGRRQLLAAAAAAALAPNAKAGELKIGQAAPINPAVLAQRVAPAVEKILRNGAQSGVTNIGGNELLRQAMKAIALTGPKEVRALAALIGKLLPTEGTIMLTVDDTRRMNVHGVVELAPFVHLSLFTAQGRTGLTYETLLHEALHVAVAARYRSLSVGLVRGNDAILGLSAPKAAEAMKQFEQVWEEFRSATVREKFGDKQLELAVHEARANPDEFFVRSLTDPVLQAYLAGKRYEGKTLWARFKDWVKSSLFGFSESGTAPSWLDAALAASGDVAAAMGADKADFSRMAAISRAQAQRQNSRVAGPDAMEQRALPAPSWADPDMNRLDNVIHTLQDKHIDMRRVVQTVRAEMGQLDDKWDPYLQEELFHGRAATGFKNYLHDELRPLLSDMQARGITVEEFEQFLHMRHAQEANEQIASVNPELPDGGSGIKTADAQDYLANQAPAKLRAFEALAQRVDAMTAETQRLLVDYSLEKQDTIDTWNATYQHYVPLMREDMEAGKLGNGTGQGFSVRGPASKRRMGSERNVVNILANIALARERAVTRGEKNRLDMALYGLALKAPNPEFWRPINPLKNPDALAAELDAMGLSPAHAAAIIAEPRQKVIDKQTGLVTRRVNPLLRSAPNVVAVRVNGEDRFVFFNEKNERALRMATTLKNIGHDGLNRFLSTAGWITRKFAAINTQYNPVFGIVNLTRDTGEGAINLTSTPIAGRQHEVIAEAGRLLGVTTANNFRLDHLSGADLALWQEFQREGGITGYRAMFSNSDDRAKELAHELKKMQAGTLLKAGHAVFDWLSDYNESLENVTRMAAYKVAKNHGLSNQQAASLAKNLTVNFNRKGAVGAQIGSLYAFFNAATQGIARMATTLNGPGGKKVIAGGILLGVMQAVMMAAAGYDDEDPPEFVKAKNFIIPLGWISGKKNYLSIPLPLGFNWLPTLGRLGTEFGLRGAKKPGKYVGHMLAALLDSFNPLGGSSTPLQIVAPTAVDPLAALAENQDWTGKPIARKDFNSLKPTPGYTRTKETASGVSKALSYYFNTWSGGTKYTPGAFSPTPDQIDYLLGQFTGGVGREALKVQQTVSATISGEALPAYKIPLAGRFYGNAEDKSSVSAKFYDNLQEINVMGEEVAGRAKDHGDVRGYLAAHPEARLADLAGTVQRDMQELGKHKRELVEKGAERSRVMELELKMRNTMDRFNKKVEEAKKKAPA